METETLSELFARDPLSLTTEDIDRIIAAQREARKNFVTTGKPAKQTTKPAIDLSDLGLL